LRLGGTPIDNPGEPPNSADAEPAPRRKSRLFKVWVFACVWPYVVIVTHKITMPLFSGNAWGRVATMVANLLIAFVVYAVCITAVVRYPASVSTRILRGIGSILLMLGVGWNWRSILGG